MQTKVWANGIQSASPRTARETKAGVWSLRYRERRSGYGYDEVREGEIDRRIW
jgi:hypothetical protein